MVLYVHETVKHKHVSYTVKINSTIAQKNIQVNAEVSISKRTRSQELVFVTS